MIASIIFIIIIGIFIKLYLDKQKRNLSFLMPANSRQILTDNVAFYRNLEPDKKLVFENRIEDFLKHVSITGVGTTVEDIDRILIASGAIIVIFAFEGWKYNNISEVLVYKDAFNEEFKSEGNSRNIIGMVGDGALQRQMILSQPSVRSSFQHPNDGHNTVIHEFVHLLDKADGAVDGVPEYLLARPYILPWIKNIHQTIQEMKHSHHSDINNYATTNDAEFFAVISEYFFEKPDQLKSHHPELYSILEQIFQNSIKH